MTEKNPERTLKEFLEKKSGHELYEKLWWNSWNLRISEGISASISGETHGEIPDAIFCRNFLWTSPSTFFKNAHSPPLFLQDLYWGQHFLN